MKAAPVSCPGVTSTPQPGGRPESILRRLLPYFLLALFVSTCFDIFVRYWTHCWWAMGDWLINYSAGFVRRGFVGECAMTLSSLSGLNPGVVVALMQASCYGIFFVFSYRLLMLQERLWPYALLIFSPFIFTYQLHVPPLHRKELIFFALLSWLVWLAKTKEIRTFLLWFYCSLLAFPLLILSHEAMAVYMPYLLILFLWKVPLTRQRILACGALVSLSVAAFLIIALSRATAAQSVKILLDLSANGYPIEFRAGAIPWISFTAEQGRAAVSRVFERSSYILYLPAVLLVAVAYLPVRSRLREIVGKPLPLMLLGCSLAGTVVLAMYATDWGRFIYIHAVALFLLALLPVTAVSAWPEWDQPRRLALSLIGAFCYISFWTMAHYDLRTLSPKKEHFYTTYPMLIKSASDVIGYYISTGGFPDQPGPEVVPLDRGRTDE